MFVDPAWLLEGPLRLLRFTNGKTQFPADPREAGAPAWSWIRAVPWGPHVGPSSVSAPIQLRKAQASGFCPQREMDGVKVHKPQGRGLSGWRSWEDPGHAPDARIAPCHPRKPNLQGHTQPRHTPHLMPTEPTAATLISGLSPEGGVGRAGSRKQDPRPVFPERC